MDTSLLKQAIQSYRKSYGQYPDELEQLVRAGILDKVPKDLDDKDYTYDRETGEVESPSKWWKR